MSENEPAEKSAFDELMVKLGHASDKSPSYNDVTSISGAGVERSASQRSDIASNAAGTSFQTSLSKHSSSSSSNRREMTQISAGEVLGAGTEDTISQPSFIHFQEVSMDGSTRRKTIEAPKDDEDETTLHRRRSFFPDFENLYQRTDSPGWQKLDRKARDFYISQNEEIDAFRELQRLDEPDDPDRQRDFIHESNRIDRIVTIASGVGNVILLLSLALAFAFSGAISIIASLLDSGLDNLSILVIVVTAWQKRRVDPYQYPQGKERLEPVGVMVFSSIMGTSSLILIIESIQKLASDPFTPPDASYVTVGLILGDLVMKFCLYLFCIRYAKTSSTAAALAQDHRNDLFLNSVALITSQLGSRYWAPLDPIGAIVIALWTGFNWSMTCYEQIQYLTGISASPDFLKRLTYICFNHDERMTAVDTVRAFHFGTRFLVEIDIVLPADMPLRQAHDIGESLQQKVERLEEVERAFVHLDFETAHNPHSEHKQWGGQ